MKTLIVNTLKPKNKNYNKRLVNTTFCPIMYESFIQCTRNNKNSFYTKVVNNKLFYKGVFNRDT